MQRYGKGVNTRRQIVDYCDYVNGCVLSHLDIEHFVVIPYFVCPSCKIVYYYHTILLAAIDEKCKEFFRAHVLKENSEKTNVAWRFFANEEYLGSLQPKKRTGQRAGAHRLTSARVWSISSCVCVQLLHTLFCS